MILFLENIWSPPAVAVIPPALAAVKLRPFTMSPQTLTPTAGVDNLAILVPTGEPLSVGAPPVRPGLVAGVGFSPDGAGRVMNDSAGYAVSSPLDVKGSRRPLFDVEWDGVTLAERNLVVAFLQGLDLPTQVGHERSAFDVELDGPGSGVTHLRPIEPFIDEWMAMAAYRVKVRCEQVL